jgi:hypothetical protein
MDKYLTFTIILSAMVLLVTIWIGFFLPINIDAQYIPTLVNGITSSISVIVGFSGVIIGIMLHESENNREAKIFFMFAVAALTVPLASLYTTYVYLTMNLDANMPLLAVRNGLFGLLSGLFVLILVLSYAMKVMEARTENRLRERQI